MNKGPYNTGKPICEQFRADCNRARKELVEGENGEETVYFCECLQDTHFNKPCPFYKKRSEQKTE